MNFIHPPIDCPECGSKDTCYLESHGEMSIYECKDCKCSFEIEES